MKAFLRSHYDVLYGLLVLLFFGLDIITRLEFFQAITFVIIFIGFTYVASNIIRYPQDERINHLASLSGFYSFMFCLMVISIASFINRYFQLALTLNEMLRYLLMFMWCLFAVIYSILRRNM